MIIKLLNSIMRKQGETTIGLTGDADNGLK